MMTKLLGHDVDSDFFAKTFDSKQGFAFGVFSVGCFCAANITYGWQIMLTRESAHNLFGLLCAEI